MGLLDLFRRKPETKSLGSTQFPSAGFVALTNGAPIYSGVRVNDVSALTVPVFLACVRIIAQDRAKLPVRHYRSRADGGRDVLADSPLSRLLRRPNRLMNANAFDLAMGAAYAARGNAIAFILRDRRGEPEELWPVWPGYVTISEGTDADGRPELFYEASRRTMLDSGMLSRLPARVPSSDVIHVRDLTYDGLIGIGNVAPLRQTIGSAISGEILMGSILGNGARPSGVLTTEQELGEEAANRIKAAWTAAYAGAHNAGGTPVLEQGLDYKPIGMTMVDAQFVESRRFMIEEIARAFRVPPYMIGIMQTRDANVEAQAKSYADQTLTPMCEAFEAELAHKFDLPANEYVEHDMKRLLRADFKARQEGSRLQVQSGAKTPNEWRVEEGYEPTPAGEVFARPLNTDYVDRDGTSVYRTAAGGNDAVTGGAPETGERDRTATNGG